MRLKYKKIVLLTMMSTLGIGLLTISLDQHSLIAKGSGTSASVKESQAEGKENNKLGALVNENDTTPDTKSSLTSMPASTLAPTPVPDHLHRITAKKNADMVRLFKVYYTAKAACDIKKLKSLLSDPTNVDSKTELQNKAGYIVDYKNIKVYAKKGLEKGTYIAYVYSEIEIFNIHTHAPSLAKFLVVAGKDGKPKIFSGLMDVETAKYYDARQNDKDVQHLMEVTNNRSERAKAKDEDLKKFWNNIDALAKSAKKSKSADSKNADGTTKNTSVGSDTAGSSKTKSKNPVISTRKTDSIGNTSKAGSNKTKTGKTTKK